MKSLTLISLLILLFSMNIAAQFSLEAMVNQGYEWNIFRNPQMVQSTSETLSRDQLWQNSIYNHFDLRSDYELDGENGRLKLSADLSINRFHQETMAHQNDYRFVASYRTKYAPRKYAEFAPSLNRKQQDGFDPSDILFSNRLSFYQFDAPVHLDFYLGNKAWLKFETSYRYKIYDQVDDSETKYSMFSLSAEYKKKWEFDKVLTGFSITSTGKLRNQSTKNLETLSQFESIKERAFNSFELESEIFIESSSGKFKIAIPVSFTRLVDAPSNNLSYTQLGTGLKLSFEIGKVGISQNMSLFARDFENFQVPANETLFYQYGRSATRISLPIIPNIVLSSKLVYAQRLSNQKVSTDAYRGYLNSYIETGITLKF